jgi:hypothetical protein
MRSNKLKILNYDVSDGSVEVKYTEYTKYREFVKMTDNKKVCVG